MHSTYLPPGKFVNQWRCPLCRNAWQTSADPASSADLLLSRSEHLRKNAGRCLTLEDTAAKDAARKQFSRMGDAWLWAVLLSEKSECDNQCHHARENRTR